MTLLEIANLPLTTESWLAGSSIKQIISFAIVCVFVNILMGFLPSSLPRLSDLKPVIQWSSTIRHRTSPPDNVLIMPVASDPAVVEKSETVIQGSPIFRHHTSPPDNVLAMPVARDPAVVEKSETERRKGIFGPHDNALTVVSDIVIYSE